MVTSLTSRPRWQLKCEWLALCAIVACFFCTYLSVTLTTATYLFAFFLILISGDWHVRFQHISNNYAAISLWALAALFVIGIFYSMSSAHFIMWDLRANIWLLITPFFIMILKENHWRQRMINAFLSIMLITICISLFKTLFHIDSTVWNQFFHLPQKKGFIFDHIKQSYAMNIAAFICAYRFLFENKFKFFYGIIFILMAIDILFISGGRTGYGIFFLLLFYLCFVRFGWRGMLCAVVLGIFIISTAFFASPVFQSRLKNGYEHATHYHQIHTITSVGERIEMMHITKILFQKRPWFGYGTGGIRRPVQEIVPLKDRILKPNINSVESIYLNYLLQFGIVGLSIFLLTIVVQIKASFKLLQPYRYLIHVVLISTLFGGLFCSFFNSFQIKHLYALLFMLCFSAFQKSPLTHQGYKST